MSSSSWIFRKQSFSFSNVTGESKCLIVTYISLSQNCVMKLYNVWAIRELKLRYDKFMKEAKAGSLWNNLVPRTFYTHDKHKTQVWICIYTAHRESKCKWEYYGITNSWLLFSWDAGKLCRDCFYVVLYLNTIWSLQLLSSWWKGFLPSEKHGIPLSERDTPGIMSLTQFLC